MVAKAGLDPPGSFRLSSLDIRNALHQVSQLTQSGQDILSTLSSDALHPPSTLWKPRSGAGHTQFRTALEDRLSSLDLLQTSNSPPPTLSDVEAAWPYLDGADLMNTYMIAVGEYQIENTQLYYVVKACVDLSGNHFESDMDHIKQMFHAADSPVRDGRGFLLWIESHNDCSSISEQNKIHMKLSNFNLTPSSPHATIDTVILEKHCTDLLSLWKKVAGNDIRSPASFNWRLLSSISPTTGWGGSGDALIRLRDWLADKVSDNTAPWLNDPALCIEKLIDHARFIGVKDDSQSGGMIAAMGARQFNKNNCTFCECFVCEATVWGGKLQNCLCFNQSDISKYSAGVIKYVTDARDYIKNNPNCKSLKGVRFRNGAQAKGAQVIAPVGIDVAMLRSILGDDEVSGDDDEFLNFIRNDTTFGDNINVIASGPLDVVPSADPDGLFESWIGGAQFDLCAPVMSANTGYTPGSMLRTLRAQSRMHADSATRGVGGAIAFCDAPAPHINTVEQEPPCQMIEYSPRAATVYTKLSTIITAIRMKLNSKDGLLAIAILIHLLQERATINSVMAAGHHKLRGIVLEYLAHFARLIHDRSRMYLITNAPISW